MDLVLGAITSLLFFYLIYTFWRWRRLAHIPGPFWPALSKFWLAKQSLECRQPSAFKHINDTYGSLARVGPNELITSDPEVLQRIMAVRSNYTRGPWYNAMKFDPSRDNLFSMRDEAAHNELRAKMAYGYSGKENISLEGTVNTHIENLINLLKTKYLSTSDEFRPLDFGEKASYFTMDVITDLSFSRPFGFLTQDIDMYDYFKITKSFVPIMMVLSDLPSLATLLQSRFLRSLMPSESDKLGFGAFIGIAKKVVAERFAPGAKPRSDMLGSFIRRGLNQDEASGEALLQVIAGSDTSAGVLRTVMLCLLTNPKAYRKLQVDIDTGIAEGKISSPVTDAEARQMPYLQAVIKEALRLMPPASGPLFKQVPPEGDTIDGKYIPGGTQIGVSILAIEHSKKIFGADAELFRPERWLTATPESLAKMTSTVDLAFSYGKWQCLGKSVAHLEINKVFIELLRQFDFSAVDFKRPAIIRNVGIWMMTDFLVRVHLRENISQK